MLLIYYTCMYIYKLIIKHIKKKNAFIDHDNDDDDAGNR